MKQDERQNNVKLSQENGYFLPFFQLQTKFPPN